MNARYSPLGDDAEEKHGQYRDRLANLTLSGDVTNPSLAARPFAEKRELYQDSPIGLTRRIADETEWDEDALERRAADLTRRVLDRWPWIDQSTLPDTLLRWRIEGGSWHTETVASQMVLNVAAALLRRDPANADRLSGEAISSNVHLASDYPPGSRVGRLTVRAVPGHEQYVLYPYERDYHSSAERCRKLGERCDVTVEVEIEGTSRTKDFWEFLKERTGGLPGQTDKWRGTTQWTSPMNSLGDRIGIYVGNPDLLWLYIRAGENRGSDERASRMRRYSWMIRERMPDQELGPSLEKNSKDGTTVTVIRPWARDDDGEWLEAARWIIEQHGRLRAILAGTSSGGDPSEP